MTTIRSAIVGQPAMTRLMVAGPAVATFAARLAAVPMARAVQGSQRGHDLYPVHRQGEGVGMPPGLPVGLGQHPHVAIADRPAKAGQARRPVTPASDRMTLSMPPAALAGAA